MKMSLAFLVGAVAEQPTFEQWVAEWGINDATQILRENYLSNVAEIERLEAEPGQTARFAVNQFSGMAWKEFAAQMLTFHGNVPTSSGVPLLGAIESFGAEDTVDWDVTPAKDQGSCGSCWAFGTIGGIEAKHKQATGETVSLSEQQLVDCDKSCDGKGTTCDSHCNCGCEGGQADWSYGDYLENIPIYTEASYSYKGRDGQCKTGTDSGIRVVGVTMVTQSLLAGMASPAMTDSSLAAAVTQGAVVVAVGANFQYQVYGGGIVTNPTTSCSLNHQQMVTGYAPNYWKVKNSWGRSWGENGFIRFARATSGCGPFGLLSYAGTVQTKKATDVTV